uniref:Putative TBP-associated protein n=1 Tax=Trichomonas vaginalis TaxID=5722 RepID=Q56DL2_TRIVA|nr:putative TBP-associated protein [Trichomonas vaginalis]
MAKAKQETLRTIFKSLGLGVDNEASIMYTLVDHAQTRILNILGNALQITHKCKRNRLTVNDINIALESLRIQPLFGYSSQIEPELVDVNGDNKLLAYDDSFVQIDQYGRRELPAYPLATSYDIDWIALNGVGHKNQEVTEDNNENNENAQLKQANQYRQFIQDSDAFVVSNKHQFSFTHQKFFRESRDALLSTNQLKKELMFYKLSRLDCIQMLVPYYVRFTLVQFRNHSNEWNTLYSSLCTARALVQNPELKNIERYLQSFITIALSFLLNSDILRTNVVGLIRIRELAAEYLVVICDKISNGYPMVQPHITSQLISVLVDPARSVSEKYGAFCGLNAFGSETIARFVLPHIDVIVKDLVKGPMRDGDRNIRIVAATYYDALVNAVGLCLYNDTARSYLNGCMELAPRTAEHREKIFETLGSLLLPFYIDESVELSI